MDPNSQNPREAWERLAKAVQQRAKAGGGGGFKGPPKGALGGLGALLFLGGAALTVNKALFNGMLPRDVNVVLEEMLVGLVGLVANVGCV